MKVYSKIILNISTGEVIYEEAHNYTGSVTQLKGGGGKSGGGGSVEYSEVYETPQKASTKSVSAGANEAAAKQKETASRNRGVAASILTQRRNTTTGSGGLTSANTGGTTLG